MNWLKQTPMAPFTIAVGTVSVLGWIVLGGTIALVISIIAGSSIAFKASLDDD
ncbi:MAG: hypothetical protein GY720_05725 [bacterium]|nr:hypothetical protein [bacterium]